MGFEARRYWWNLCLSKAFISKQLQQQKSVFLFCALRLMFGEALFLTALYCTVIFFLNYVLVLVLDVPFPFLFYFFLGSDLEICQRSKLTFLVSEGAKWKIVNRVWACKECLIIKILTVSIAAVSHTALHVFPQHCVGTYCTRTRHVQAATRDSFSPHT